MKNIIIFTILATLSVSQPVLVTFRLNKLLQLATLPRLTPTAFIDPFLEKILFSGQKQNVMVSFTPENKHVIDQVNRMHFSSIGDKRSTLTGLQQAFASTTQAPLQRLLETAGVLFKTLWINNMMFIDSVDLPLAKQIRSMPMVAKIGQDIEYTLAPIFPNISQSSNTTPWGIQTIRANQVWRSYTGKGMVVGNIDTGVRPSHETLFGRWRTNLGWFDPIAGTTTPNDQNGHGTHTMGTIAGGMGIGVAPDATWIAAQAFTPTGNAFYSIILQCCQWMQCPFDLNVKDCSMAPDVISNSWGGGQGNSEYDSVIKSWNACGIISVFAIGNSGSECGTANSPGDRPNVIGVGSTEQNEQISSFSSLGPTVDGIMKPDISAPGGNVFSAWHLSDTAYKTISGTSMACPHVAGTVVLMCQKKNNLTSAEAYKAITETAVTQPLSTSKNCGDTKSDQFPNHVFGHGRIDALNAVNAVQ